MDMSESSPTTAPKRPTKVSKRFERMCEVYRVFAEDWAPCCDFSEAAKLQMYLAETFGDPIGTINGAPPVNGYLVGKHWLNVTMAMWAEDKALGHLVVSELREDPRFPKWWRESLFT
jgi:hypothetical protein